MSQFSENKRKQTEVSHFLNCSYQVFGKSAPWGTIPAAADFDPTVHSVFAKCGSGSLDNRIAEVYVTKAHD